MASSEDYKKLYELYQVEGVLKGISIVDFCQRNVSTQFRAQNRLNSFHHSDSTGSVCGNLMGAIVGVKACNFPDMDKLELKSLLLNTVRMK